jgi:hypothetical protein
MGPISQRRPPPWLMLKLLQVRKSSSLSPRWARKTVADSVAGTGLDGVGWRRKVGPSFHCLLSLTPSCNWALHSFKVLLVSRLKVRFLPRSPTIPSVSILTIRCDALHRTTSIRLERLMLAHQRRGVPTTHQGVRRPRLVWGVVPLIQKSYRLYRRGVPNWEHQPCDLGDLLPAIPPR